MLEVETVSQTGIPGVPSDVGYGLIALCLYVSGELLVRSFRRICGRRYFK